MFLKSMNIQPFENNPFGGQKLEGRKLGDRRLGDGKFKSTLNVILQLQFSINYHELWLTITA